jgi:aryl-alcohol dehydrogenase-like predicted oxidoreductase
LKTIELGRTGLRVSRLAIGTGTKGYSNSSAQTRQGPDVLPNMLRVGFELGVNFWDLADLYGSHPHAKRALGMVPRESVVVSTKTQAKTEAEATAAVERFLDEIGTDHLDIVHLHGIKSDDWATERAGAMAALTRFKERGIIRALGVSVHSLGALATLPTEPWVDVVLARINSTGVNMDDMPDKVVPILHQIHAAGKGLYAMKTLGQGALTGDVRGALAFVHGLGCVDSLNVGVESEAELRECVRIVEELDGE